MPAGTDRAIRWVHATERPDVRQLLRAGDLLLTMGTGLPDDDDAAGLVSFVDELADVGSAGVVVELGRRWGAALPDALVDACERHGLPLVVLARETRFAALAQEIGERVVDQQLAELREAQRVHETFTELQQRAGQPRRGPPGRATPRRRARGRGERPAPAARLLRRTR